MATDNTSTDISSVDPSEMTDEDLLRLFTASQEKANAPMGSLGEVISPEQLASMQDTAREAAYKPIVEQVSKDSTNKQVVEDYINSIKQGKEQSIPESIQDYVKNSGKSAKESAQVLNDIPTEDAGSRVINLPDQNLPVPQKQLPTVSEPAGGFYQGETAVIRHPEILNAEYKVLPTQATQGELSPEIMAWLRQYAPEVAEKAGMEGVTGAALGAAPMLLSSTATADPRNALAESLPGGKAYAKGPDIDTNATFDKPHSYFSDTAKKIDDAVTAAEHDYGNPKLALLARIAHHFMNSDAPDKPSTEQQVAPPPNELVGKNNLTIPLPANSSPMTPEEIKAASQIKPTTGENPYYSPNAQDENTGSDINKDPNVKRDIASGSDQPSHTTFVATGPNQQQLMLGLLQGQSQSQLANQLGKAATQIGAAIAGGGRNTLTPNTQGFDQNIALGQQNTQMLAPLLQNNKLNPNSTASQFARFVMKDKFGVDVPDNVSASDVENYVGPIERLESAQLMAKFRAQNFGLAQDKSVGSAIQKLEGEVNPAKASSRSPLGKSALTVDQAQRLEVLLNSQTDPNNFTQRDIYEMASGIDNMLRNGNVSQTGTEHLIPKTAMGKLSSIEEYITNQVHGANAGDFVNRYKDLISREKEANSALVKKYQAQAINAAGSQPIFQKYGKDQLKSFANGYGFDESGKELQKQENTQSNAHPQDQQAIQWAKDHPDDPRSQTILKANGL